MVRMGRYRFEFEYPGIGWQMFGKYNTDNLADAKKAATDVAFARMLDGCPAKFRAVRVVDSLVAETRNPHAAPRDRIKFLVSVADDGAIQCRH